MASIVQPQDWPRPRGYSHGMVASGQQIYIAGQVGNEPRSGAVSADFGQQVAQAFRNIVAVLRAASAWPEHLVQMTWFVTDKAAYQAAGPAIAAAWRETFGKHYPPITLIFVSGLVDDRAKVEIEAIAVVPAPEPERMP
ncbi:MAG: RidA family protein [Alphaproteobacteria bacterium]|nr:RidA family protein [Alphaproteobacteria bacterium]